MAAVARPRGERERLRNVTRGEALSVQVLKRRIGTDSENIVLQAGGMLVGYAGLYCVPRVKVCVHHYATDQ